MRDENEAVYPSSSFALCVAQVNLWRDRLEDSFRRQPRDRRATQWSAICESRLATWHRRLRWETEAMQPKEASGG